MKNTCLQKIGFSTVMKLHAEGDKAALKRFLHKSSQVPELIDENNISLAILKHQRRKNENKFSGSFRNFITISTVCFFSLRMMWISCFPSWEKETMSLNFIVDVNHLYRFQMNLCGIYISVWKQK